MTKRFLFTFILGLTISSKLVSAVTYPTPFRATYQGGKYLLFSAESIISLERYNNYYKYTMTSEGGILFIRRKIYDCGVMRIHNHNIYPVEHKHYDKDDMKYTSHTSFNWTSHKAVTKFGDGRNISTTLQSEPTWDPMSVQVKVMYDLLNKQLHSTNTYKLIEYANLSDHPMKYSGKELVVSPYQSLQGHKIESSKDDGNILWFSSEYHYLPVRMEISGVVMELVSDPASARQQAHRVADDFIPKC